MPNTEDDWLNVSCGFRKRFPHAVGAIDVKQVIYIDCPKTPPSLAPSTSKVNGESKKKVAKKSHSIVLLTVVDSNFFFLFADIGIQEHLSDGRVLKNSILWKKMENNELTLPPPSPLARGSASLLPYVFLGDCAFGLHNALMIPYPGERPESTREGMFNRKLMSARVVVENAFGVLSTVFKVLRKPLQLDPDASMKVVKACVNLHNYLRMSQHSFGLYSPPGTFDTFESEVLINKGSWRTYPPQDPGLRTMRQIPWVAPYSAIEIRDRMANNFEHFQALI